MGSKITDDELVMEGYKALYAAATPSADFEELVNNCTRFVDDGGKVHITDKPLTKEECISRGWHKDIEYMNYELAADTYYSIINSIVEKYNLKGFRAEAFKNTMLLGSGPNISKNR